MSGVALQSLLEFGQGLGDIAVDKRQLRQRKMNLGIVRRDPRGFRKGRRSGLSMLWTALPMIFSGYALQVSVEQLWRVFWTTIHIIASLAWMAGHFIHFRIHHKDREAAEKARR